MPAAFVVKGLLASAALYDVMSAGKSKVASNCTATKAAEAFARSWSGRFSASVKGSMATLSFVVRLAFPIMGMLLIGRKAIICGWVRRLTCRSGWRATVVGFMTRAAAEHTHVRRRAIFAVVFARTA